MVYFVVTYTMYSTFELYGIRPDKFKNKPYIEALDIKINAGRDYLKVISAQAKLAIDDPDHYYVLMKQYVATEKAIKYNINLQMEIQDGNE